MSDKFEDGWYHAFTDAGGTLMFRPIMVEQGDYVVVKANGTLSLVGRDVDQQPGFSMAERAGLADALNEHDLRTEHLSLVANVIEALEVQHAAIKDLRNERSVLQRRVREIGQERDRFQVRVNALSGVDQTNTRLREQLSNMTNQRNNLERKLRLIDAGEVDDLRRKLAAARKSCQDMREERDEASKSAARHADRARIAEGKHLDARDAHTKDVRSMRAREAKALTTCRELRARIERLQVIVQQANAKLNESGVTFTGRNQQLPSVEQFAEGGPVSAISPDIWYAPKQAHAPGEDPWDRA
jgi:DNA repair exonuclease SbcCD ATPase subunit